MAQQPRGARGGDGKKSGTMQLVIESNYFRRVMEAAYKNGYLECQRALAPVSDELRQVDVREWLASMGMDRRIFLKLRRAGAIKPYRKGTKTNSALFYHRSEIIRAFDEYLHSGEAPNSFHVFAQQDLLERIVRENAKAKEELALGGITGGNRNR